jgi:hypothetical protein
MVRRIDDALEEALALMAEGKIDLEGALARYPEMSADLRSMLTAAGRVGDLGGLQPTAEFKARGRAQLLTQMGAKPRRQTGRRTLAFRYAVSFASLLFAFGTVGTALAQKALPGDTLYSWKLISESIWRGFQNNVLNADLALAERRVGELNAVSGFTDLEQIGVDGYVNLIGQIRLDLLTSPDSIERVNGIFTMHRESLSDLFANSQAHLPNPDELFSTIVPEPQQPAPAGDAQQVPADGSGLEIPLVATAIPAIKREETDTDGSEAGGWLEETIEDLLGLP